VKISRRRGALIGAAVLLSTLSIAHADSADPDPRTDAFHERLAGAPASASFPIPGARTSDWRDIKLTFRSVGSRLLHPRTSDWIAWSILATGGYALERNKRALAGEVQEQRDAERDEASSAFRPLGEAFIPVAVVSTYFIGRFSGSESTRRDGLILSEAAALTVVATSIGQFVFSEQRPADGGKLSFFRLGGHGVSGHTSIMASVAVPLDRLFFRIHPEDGGFKRMGKILGKIAVYSAPALVGWSRMNDNKHYAWNVFLGMGTGYLMGNYVADAHGLGAEGRFRASSDWGFVPISSDRGAPGLAFRWLR